MIYLYDNFIKIPEKDDKKLLIFNRNICSHLKNII
jgi:hypothetical protein